MKHLLVFACVVALIGLYFMLNSSDDPGKQPPRSIEIQLGQSVADFMVANDLKEGSGGLGEFTVPVDKTDDRMPIFFTDVWVAVRYKDGDFSLDLPPGRMLAIGQSGGIITNFDVKLNEQPHPFAVADKAARAFIDQLLKAGWRKESLFYPENEMDSNYTSNAKAYGTLVSGSGNKLHYILLDVSQTPAFDPNLPGSAPITPSDPTPRFLPQLQIWAPEKLRDTRDDVVRARRFLADTQKDTPPGLRTWLDDPEWTPEAHGMKQIDVPNPNWNPQKPWLGKETIKRWQLPDGSTQQ
ncbi:hypothetical protein [Mesorhizobium retamae]|uniref:Uncharacterized protein n=1 Tax=Mesorhizobium retamae TaxID=2912854 RepID=A0ABS9QP71_9HYPH|nr:hypothetical protein [Mesorhizobium sp. IRAMC:0171]MCG7509247.1 hypothetical protein [Mesorhizobium sp. IRAMC:0171]